MMVPFRKNLVFIIRLRSAKNRVVIKKGVNRMSNNQNNNQNRENR